MLDYLLWAAASILQTPAEEDGHQRKRQIRSVDATDSSSNLLNVKMQEALQLMRTVLYHVFHDILLLFDPLWMCKSPNPISASKGMFHRCRCTC